MEDAFETVLFAVVAVSAIAALLSVLSSRGAYRQLGRGGLTMEGDEAHREQRPSARPTSTESSAEIRQMLEARNVRRARRGQEPLDVEAQLRRLTDPAAHIDVDPALREEVRQLVVARNVRRARRGEEPLDVEAETERQLRALG